MERSTSYSRVNSNLNIEKDLEKANLIPKLKSDKEDCNENCVNLNIEEGICKHDGRLFPEFPLYHEGMHKPMCRGYLHVLLALLIPFAFYQFYIESNGNIYAIYSSFFYLFTNIFCYGMSGLYHTIKWSPQTEILLQKLDHCGIALLSWGTFIPVSVLLMEYPYGFIFANILMITCFYNFYHILILNSPSVIRQAIVPATFLPFLPYIYYLMTPFEFNCTISCIICQIIGVIIYTKEQPNIHPSIFGYHELFHCFVSSAGICVYLCNWSIIHRLCNNEN